MREKKSNGDAKDDEKPGCGHTRSNIRFYSMLAMAQGRVFVPRSIPACEAMLILGNMGSASRLSLRAQPLLWQAVTLV